MWVLRDPELPRTAAEPGHRLDPDRGRQTEAREIVLVAQDLASYGKDRPDDLGAGSIVPLVDAVADRG